MSYRAMLAERQKSAQQSAQQTNFDPDKLKVNLADKVLSFFGNNEASAKVNFRDDCLLLTDACVKGNLDAALALNQDITEHLLNRGYDPVRASETADMIWKACYDKASAVPGNKCEEISNTREMFDSSLGTKMMSYFGNRDARNELQCDFSAKMLTDAYVTGNAQSVHRAKEALGAVLKERYMDVDYAAEAMDMIDQCAQTTAALERNQGKLVSFGGRGH